MSVIVKGMEMPECCAGCFAISDSLGWCKASGNDIYSPFSMDGRPSFCPLRPMPEKHGRLIDADDMERFMSDTVQGDIRQYPYSDTLWDMAFKWIDSRPTIVEAEGE